MLGLTVALLLLFSFVSFSLSFKFVKSPCFKPNYCNSQYLESRQNHIIRSPNRDRTSLNLDLFGLGPTEVVVIIAAGAILFGPAKVKEQLRESGVKNDLLLSDDPNVARAKRITEMKRYAQQKRKERAWERVNAEIDSENTEVLKKLEEFENQ